jgi:hypothetical protein
MNEPHQPLLAPNGAIMLVVLGTAAFICVLKEEC